MRLIDIFRTASGNIWQSKLRTILTIIAVFIGAFTLVLTTGIGAGISQYIDGQVSGIGAKNVLMITAKTTTTSVGSSTDPQKYDPDKITRQRGGGGVDGGESTTLLTDKDVAKIETQSGILDATPQRSVSPDYISGSNKDKYLLSVSHYIDGTNVVMNAGVITSNTSTQSEIALPYNYVSVLGFANYADAVGKTVKIGITDSTGTLSEVSAVVVGVPEKSLMSSDGASVNSTLFDKLYEVQSVGLPAASLNRYAMVVAHFDSSYTDAQVTDLKNRLDKDGYTGQTIADTIATVKKIISGIVIVFDIFAIIALLAASFGVINTLLMSVQERTKEIGLMKAVGMGRRRIFLLFSIEAILLGFWGSFLGVLVAIGVGKIANQIATRTFLKDFEGLHLLAFPPMNLVLIVLGIMFVAFLAGTLPARRASGLNPIDALRYE
ncbi:MAG TPA: ABC transporter permease [Candidatus Saccharimonadales bacterium]|nr:ABC transporter permease [Candidatus Saccharimonadales bacterium]